IFANNLGVTGGLFIPSLAFGALLGALCGKGLIALGILPESYYGVLVIVGMCAFLGASSRTPLMAIAFSMEALSGINNVMPVILGVCFAYVVIELTGAEDFVDTVLFKKIRHSAKGTPTVAKEEKFTVQPHSFVIGKEVRDILWPPRCQVLSIDHVHAAAHGGATLEQGDVLHLHYYPDDEGDVDRQMEALLGHQEKEN
ncbi:MAG: chloride channel protein, partial [Clostridia bacterium]|nr:chloride channel protein [Clostridia bacterium]